MAEARGWKRIALVGVFVVGCVCWGVRSDAETKYAAPGELRLDLQLLAENGRMVATEPLLAVVTLTNVSAEERYVDIGNHLKPYAYFRVEDARGRLVGPPRPSYVGAPPYIRNWGGFAARLAPGASTAKVRLVSEWYQFSNPGQYRIRAEWLGGRLNPVVLGSDDERIVVDPFDASRFDAALQRPHHFRRVYGKKWPGGDNVAWRALMSVRHDAVLPYLDVLARMYGSDQFCLAIRRVGTPRAKQLIAELAARRDRVGDAARRALEMPLDADRPPAYLTAP